MWERAVKALDTAENLLALDADSAANRAYYSAFYAMSALLANQGEYFKRHTGLRAAVHRDLVKTGRLPKEIGEMYDALLKLRGTADYGGREHATFEETQSAVKYTRRILRAVSEMNPSVFKMNK